MEGLVVIVQLLSHVQLFATPYTAAGQASLSFTLSWNLLKLMSVELVMPSNHLILHCSFSSSPQSFPALGSFPMSHQVANYWSFHFSISPSNEYSELISYGLSFCFIYGFLCCAKALKFNSVPFVYFVFIFIPLRGGSKKILL